MNWTSLDVEQLAASRTKSRFEGNVNTNGAARAISDSKKGKAELDSHSVGERPKSARTHALYPDAYHRVYSDQVYSGAGPGYELLSLPRSNTFTEAPARDASPSKPAHIVRDDAVDADGTPLQPVGQTIVRYIWFDSDDSVPSVPAAIVVMLKLDPTTPGTDEGWIYGSLSPDGKTVQEAGAIKGCIDCHKAQGKDRLIGPRPAIGKLSSSE